MQIEYQTTALHEKFGLGAVGELRRDSRIHASMCSFNNEQCERMYNIRIRLDHWNGSDVQKQIVWVNIGSQQIGCVCMRAVFHGVPTSYAHSSAGARQP